MFHFLLPLTQVLSFTGALLLKLATFFYHKNQETDVDGHFSSINRPFLEYQHLENSVWTCYSQIKMKFLNHHPIPALFCQIASRWKQISVPFRHSILHPPLWHDFHSPHRSVLPHWVEYGCRCASERASAHGIRCESPGFSQRKRDRKRNLMGEFRMARMNQI